MGVVWAGWWAGGGWGRGAAAICNPPASCLEHRGWVVQLEPEMKGKGNSGRQGRAPGPSWLGLSARLAGLQSEEVETRWWPSEAPVPCSIPAAETQFT